MKTYTVLMGALDDIYTKLSYPKVSGLVRYLATLKLTNLLRKRGLTPALIETIVGRKRIRASCSILDYNNYFRMMDKISTYPHSV